MNFKFFLKMQTFLFRNSNFSKLFSSYQDTNNLLKRIMDKNLCVDVMKSILKTIFFYIGKNQVIEMAYK